MSAKLELLRVKGIIVAKFTEENWLELGMITDMPFDLIHHRFLRYLANNEGLATLRQNLKERLLMLKG